MCRINHLLHVSLVSMESKNLIYKNSEIVYTTKKQPLKQQLSHMYHECWVQTSHGLCLSTFTDTLKYSVSSRRYCVLVAGLWPREE